ncbi:hypothetical protein ACLKA6_013622 [Drosophila palustris]
MLGGSDRDPSRQLKVPPSRAVRRSSSNSPIPQPKLPAARTVRRSTSNSPILPSKVPAQSPIGTRSQVQRQSASTMALSDFTSLADRLSQFEAKLGAASIVEEDVYALEIRRNRITSLWEKIDDEYGRCSKVLSKSSTESKKAIESRDVVFLENDYGGCASDVKDMFLIDESESVRPQQTVDEGHEDVEARVRS